jgi:protocatechuate 3,4-dioxygenase, beta subunit
MGVRTQIMVSGRWIHAAPCIAIALVVLAGAAALVAPRPRAVAGVTRQAAGVMEVRLCDEREPGQRLAFGGRVLDYDGRPLAKAAVVAYNADRQGLYNPRNSRTRVPRLRGVAITDRQGHFRFRTVKPGPYPNLSEPAHIHVSVLAPAHEVRYVDYWFEGDPLITRERRARTGPNANTVVVRPRDRGDGVHEFQHDIRLEGN